VSGGVVTAVSAGTAVIFASIDGVLGWTDVTVIPPPVASVTVSPPSSSVGVGQTVQLSVTLKDAGGNTLLGRVTSWTSDQPSIASVTSGGLVTGAAAGTAVITAMSEGQSGTATVTVTGTGSFTVTVLPDTATVAPLGTVQLAAVVRDPGGAVVSNPAVSWSSGSPLVADVSSSGLVTALLPGTAVISAASNGATGTATITVK
jgi:uncharacterized protein YjdB